MTRATGTAAALYLFLALGAVGFCQYAPTLLRVPASGASFVPPDEAPARPAAGTRDADIAEIKQDLKEIKELLKSLVDDADPEKPAADPKATEALNAGFKTCVGCHNDRDAPKKGDRFVLFNVTKEGNVFRDDFTDRELRKIESEVAAGTMPRKSSGKRLTPDQKGAILEEIKARRAKLADG